jgi:hypothetical protein
MTWPVRRTWSRRWGRWRIYRYTKYDVYGNPERIVAELTRALSRS